LPAIYAVLKALEGIFISQRKVWIGLRKKNRNTMEETAVFVDLYVERIGRITLVVPNLKNKSNCSSHFHLDLGCKFWESCSSLPGTTMLSMWMWKLKLRSIENE